MALTLYSHPLSSYCWKVLIALYENGTPFNARMVNLGDPEAKAAFKTLWPTAKIPLLEDGNEIIPETSIMIEHIEQRHPGKVRLIPQDPHKQLERPAVGPPLRSICHGADATLHCPAAASAGGAGYGNH